MLADKIKQVKYLKGQQEDIKLLFKKRILDAHVFEDNKKDNEDDRQHKFEKESNMDVLIPHKDNKDVPDFLIDFIENDPNFIPEIHCNNLEDVFMNLHKDENLTTETNTILTKLKSGYLDKYS